MRKWIQPICRSLLPLLTMTTLSSSGDDSCNPEPTRTTERRIKRTKDGSVFIFEPTLKVWQREAAQVVEPVDGVVPALPWAQFNVSFDGNFNVDGRPLLLAEGRGLRDQDEQQHADTGRSIWDGAIAMAKSLEQCRWLIDGKSVLELGAGRGVVSLSAARLGAKSIVATDLPYVLEDLQEGAKINRCSVSDRNMNDNNDSSVDVAEFDWMDPAKFFGDRSPSERFDVVLGADVIWLMELVEPLVNALRVICERNPDADVLIVHQRRAANVEQAFLAAMSDAGLVLEWTLRGSSTEEKHVNSGQKVSWHPDFTPDDRMSLWAFHLGARHH